MPFLVGHPLRGVGIEQQRGPAHFGIAAAIDAVAGVERGFELAHGQVLRLRLEQLRLAHRIEREAAQAVAGVAPGVEVPGGAVVHQALRRDLALAHAPVAALEVAQPDAPALHQRAAEQLEPAAGHRPPRRADDLDAPHQLARFGGVVADQPLQPLEHGLQVARQHAVVVQPGEQLVHGQQRVDLVLAEPHARQLVAGARRRALVEAVAVVEGVVDDGRVQPVAQVLQVALERGRRDGQLLAQRREAHAAAAAQQHLDLVEAFGAVHRVSLYVCRQGSSRHEPPGRNTASHAAARGANRGTDP